MRVFTVHSPFETISANFDYLINLFLLRVHRDYIYICTLLNILFFFGIILRFSETLSANFNYKYICLDLQKQI